MAFDKKFLFLVYGTLIVLSCLGFESKVYIPFYLAFAFYVGWTWFFGERERKEKLKLSRWLIIIPLVIIFAVRIVPFLSSPNPLGYDTGIYKKLIEDFASALPGLPQFAEGMWGSSQPWGLFLNTNLLSLIGFSSSQILYGYYILLNLLLGLSVYTLVKKFFNRNAAICSLFIFALSLTQFHTYWMMYYKNILGMFLMLTAFYLLKQKSWLVIPLAGFLGATHRPTFLIFGLAMLINYESLSEFKYFTNHIRMKANNMRMNMLRITKRMKANNIRINKLEIRKLFASIREGFVNYYHLISGAGILATAFSLYIHNPQAIFQFLSPNPQELAKTFGPGAGAGTFFDFSLYRQIITFYLPFAVLGFIYLIRKRQFNYLFSYFIFNFAIVYFGLIFHNRFIIHLDIIVIVLAGIGASFVLAKLFPTLAGKAAICILLMGAVYILGTVVLNKKPLISEEELAEIKSLTNLAKENEYVMATDSYYSPWVYGFSGRKTIAPGLFEYNKWNREKWAAFWFSSDLDLRHFLLDEYQKPIYIFVGDKQHPMDFSDDPRFTKISKRVWKFNR